MSNPNSQDYGTMEAGAAAAAASGGGGSNAPPQSGNNNSHQAPVNFNPISSGSGRASGNAGHAIAGGGGGGDYPSRRVTIGGIHGSQMMNDMQDRRGSMASMNLDDFFQRRPSMGFEMDALFAADRRGSMDSTSAALDAAILDLTRRRYSMAMGGAEGGQGQGNFGNNSGGAVGSIAARQQQLQQQQRELEQRQKDLEMQRQQLIASMQERNTMMSGSMRGNSMGMGNSVYGTGGGGGGYRNSDSLGLGSVGSHGSQHNRPSVPTATTSGSGGQQWWICQICNKQAFASHEEAMVHEETCQGVPQPTRRSDYGSNPMNNYSEMSHYSQSTASNMHGGRNFSMGMDSSMASYEVPVMSTGPFAEMDKPMPLAMPSDRDWLTPLHCFVRGHCVEVFTATEADVATPSKGKRKPIAVGQAGIRCPHCHSEDGAKARERGSVYYPTTIASIYNATMNLLQRHLHSCTAVPDEIMRRYETLKADDARSGTSKRYWIESALALGLVDTPNGIRFSALPPPPAPLLSRQQDATRRTSNEYYDADEKVSAGKAAQSPKARQLERAQQDDEKSHDGKQQNPDMINPTPLVEPEDKPFATEFSYALLAQMQPCVFTEADRLGKRKGLPPGFPGLACRHCFGGYGSGRFFPSSIKTLSDTSKTLNVLHNHMMRCRKCPADVREQLEKMRGSHDDERSKMKFGSQKAFFARIWDRLHGKDAPVAHKRKPAGPPGHASMGGGGGGYPMQSAAAMRGGFMGGGGAAPMGPMAAHGGGYGSGFPPQTMAGTAGLDALARATTGEGVSSKRAKTQHV